MAADDLQELITTVPFFPFVLSVADGRRIPVVGRESILLMPVGHNVVVCQPDGKIDLLDMALVTGASYGPPARPAATPTDTQLPA
jgi:hypothetical protein